MSKLSKEIHSIVESLLGPITCLSLLFAAVYDFDEHFSKLGWTGITGGVSIICVLFSWRIFTATYESEIDGSSRHTYGKMTKSASVVAVMVSVVVFLTSIYASLPKPVPNLRIAVVNDDSRPRTFHPRAVAHLSKISDDENADKLSLTITQRDSTSRKIMPGATQITAHFADQATAQSFIDTPGIRFKIELSFEDGHEESGWLEFTRESVTQGITIRLLDRERRFLAAKQLLKTQLPKALDEARTAEESWKWHALLQIGKSLIRTGDESGRAVIREVVDGYHRKGISAPDVVVMAQLALGDMEAASTTLNELPGEARFMHAFRKVTLRKLDTGDVEGAFDALNSYSGDLEPQDLSWCAEQLAIRGHIARSLEIVDRLDTEAAQSPLCAVVGWYAGRDYELAEEYLSKLDPGFFRDAAIVSLVGAYADDKNYSTASTLIESVGQKKYIHFPLSIAALAAGYGRNGQRQNSSAEFNRAFESLFSLRSAMTDNPFDVALEEIVALELELGFIAEAEKHSSFLTGWDHRARSYAKVAATYFDHGDKQNASRCIEIAVAELEKQSQTEYAVEGIAEVTDAIVRIGLSETLQDFEAVETVATTRVDIIGGIVSGIESLKSP